MKKKGFEHPILSQVEILFSQFDSQQLKIYQATFLYHCIQQLKKQLLEYKLNHSQKGFDDLLLLVRSALYAEQGEDFAHLIRNKFPFAMIDEFQDTDELQYQIFAKIYMQEASQHSGFIMIGDPKQSIYRFRGADIFTYLKASKQADNRFTLDQNWRSGSALINAVNHIFDFAEPPPFIYQDIGFYLCAKARLNLILCLITKLSHRSVVIFLNKTRIQPMQKPVRFLFSNG